MKQYKDGTIVHLKPLNALPVTSDSVLAHPEPQPMRSGRLEFTATIRMTHKNRVTLGKFVGILKQSRTTFKTIKRDCAKRNRS